jgi:hypothetical protein
MLSTGVCPNLDLKATWVPLDASKNIPKDPVSIVE